MYKNTCSLSFCLFPYHSKHMQSTMSTVIGPFCEASAKKIPLVEIGAVITLTREQLAECTRMSIERNNANKANNTKN